MMWKKIAMIGLLSMPMLSACGSADIPVSIHAVNYSNQEFVYFLEDPADKSNNGGGEAISRFAAGGTMCCYSLPKEWGPGMKVKVVYDVYVPNPGGEIPKTSKSTVIEIPRYVKPSELWLVRDVQGDMSIVLSDFQPDHPKWPGKVKGWPVLPVAYLRERADIEINTLKSDVDALQSLSKGMRSAPNETAKGLWEIAQIYDRAEIAGYSGYQDLRYQNFLIDDLGKSLKRTKEALKNLEAARP